MIWGRESKCEQCDIQFWKLRLRYCGHPFSIYINNKRLWVNWLDTWLKWVLSPLGTRFIISVTHPLHQWWAYTVRNNEHFSRFPFYYEQRKFLRAKQFTYLLSKKKRPMSSSICAGNLENIDLHRKWFNRRLFRQNPSVDFMSWFWTSTPNSPKTLPLRFPITCHPIALNPVCVLSIPLSDISHTPTYLLNIHRR